MKCIPKMQKNDSILGNKKYPLSLKLAVKTLILYSKEKKGIKLISW